MKTLFSLWCVIATCSSAIVPHNDAVSNTTSQNQMLQISKSDIKIFFYSRNSKNGVEVDITDPAAVRQTHYISGLRTYFVIHGWINEHRSDMCREVKDAYLAADDVNVFVVDWSKLSFKEYVQARNQIVPIGNVIGGMISSMVSNNLLSLESVTIVGHSLGAHLAGVTGKVLKGGVEYIVGLDPAGPFFFAEVTRDRLTKGDAKYVQVLHTCAHKLGFGVAIGDADFWANGGAWQPGCPNDADIVGICSHGRAYELFAESVKTGNFIARHCDDYESYKKGLCNNTPKAYFGEITLDLSAKGNYFFDTRMFPPFAKGL